MKTEVYSWRVSAEVKARLAREARRRNISISAALDLAARDWLSKSSLDGEAEEQLRLRNAVSGLLGIISSGDDQRSQKARETVRQRVRRRHGR